MTANFPPLGYIDIFVSQRWGPKTRMGREKNWVVTPGFRGSAKLMESCSFTVDANCLTVSAAAQDGTILCLASKSPGPGFRVQIGASGSTRARLNCSGQLWSSS